jgi:hypothetical protein
LGSSPQKGSNSTSQTKGVLTANGLHRCRNSDALFVPKCQCFLDNVVAHLPASRSWNDPAGCRSVRRIARWQACWLGMMHTIRIMKLGPYGKTKVPRLTEPGHGPAILRRRGGIANLGSEFYAPKTSKRRTRVARWGRATNRRQQLRGCVIEPRMGKSQGRRPPSANRATARSE